MGVQWGTYLHVHMKEVISKGKLREKELFIAFYLSILSRVELGSMVLSALIVSFSIIPAAAVHHYPLSD